MYYKHPCVSERPVNIKPTVCFLFIQTLWSRTPSKSRVLVCLSLVWRHSPRSKREAETRYSSHLRMTQKSIGFTLKFCSTTRSYRLFFFAQTQALVVSRLPTSVRVPDEHFLHSRVNKVIISPLKHIILSLPVSHGALCMVIPLKLSSFKSNHKHRMETSLLFPDGNTQALWGRWNSTSKFG